VAFSGLALRLEKSWLSFLVRQGVSSFVMAPAALPTMAEGIVANALGTRIAQSQPCKRHGCVAGSRRSSS